MRNAKIFQFSREKRAALLLHAQPGWCTHLHTPALKHVARRRQKSLRVSIQSKLLPAFAPSRLMRGHFRSYWGICAQNQDFGPPVRRDGHLHYCDLRTTAEHSPPVARTRGLRGAQC